MQRTTHLLSAALAAAAVLVALATADDPAAAPVAPAAAPDAATIAERYRETADRIIEAALAGNDGYRKLEHLCDDVGHRLSGSPALDRAIEWAVKALEADGHENVRTEKVSVPVWVRGRESLELIEPHAAAIPMLGLGNSIGTGPDGITAEVISVTSEDDLHARADEIAGKIVLFDFPMKPGDGSRGSGYGPAVRYRSWGARLAAQHGGVAALVRSVTTRSLQSPHTGAMSYAGAERQVPSAAVSTEWAARISRLCARGIPVKAKLYMEARMNGEAPSANVIAEIRGREKPDEIVVMGGHIDSWDVGQGAQDDGGGCVQAMEALNVLRKLDLRPRRTIRVVLWTNEENGLAGGRAYAKDHADELPNHVAAIESDGGTFAPQGFGVSLDDPDRQKLALEQLQQITSLLERTGATTARPGGGGADIGPMKPAGVPMMSINVDMTHYFDYHHTDADTFDKIDKGDLDRCIASLAVMTYVLADMEERFAGAPTAPPESR